MKCPHCGMPISSTLAAKLLGGCTSPKKAKSSRENGKRGYTRAMREAKGKP